jgi:hypothetical protein
MAIGHGIEYQEHVRKKYCVKTTLNMMMIMMMMIEGNLASLQF